MKCPIDNVTLNTADADNYLLEVNGSVMAFESNEDARFVFDLLNKVRGDYVYFNWFFKKQESLNKQALDLMRDCEIRTE